MLVEAYHALEGEEKDKYAEMAKADKARHDEDVEKWEEDRGEGDEEEETKKKRKAKKKKDPNAPKGATNAFIFFSNANRARIKEENPDAKFTEVVRFVWKLSNLIEVGYEQTHLGISSLL